MGVAVLNRKVLVLNKGWNPVAVVSLERAMCLVIGDYADGESKARIIDATQDFRQFTWADWSKLKAAENEEVIRSANDAFRIPEIILLSKYNKLPRQKIQGGFSRRTIYKRDGNECKYCGAKPGVSELSLDHVVPKSAGGLTTWENVILACTQCNRDKADRIPDLTFILEKNKDGKEINIPAFIVYFNRGRKKVIRQPLKPDFALYKGDFVYKSWIDLMGEIYWSGELQNDNQKA